MADEARTLDPEGHYSAEDLVVTSRTELPLEGGGRISDQLPARELVYRLVRERGDISLAELSREFATIAPGLVRPPYAQDPELYVLRLVLGGRVDLPPLADLSVLVRLAAENPGPDPDYGLEVRGA
jgi:hypothetical protein